MTAPEVDLLVLGAGMAGLASAARAVQGGASVVLAEKAPTVGGSAALAGFLWTAPSEDVMRRVNPDGDPELGRRLVASYEPAIEWVQSLGVEVKDPVPLLGYGRGRQTDMAALLTTCERIVSGSERGELLLETTTERLLVENGRVCGAELVLASGERRTVRAAATVLATGGFGGDPDLRAELIHPLARDIPLRANVFSTGDGLRLGRAAGAAFGPPDAGFYGHLIPSRIPFEDPFEFVKLAFYHSEHSVLLNLRGERFVDETVGDHLNTMAVLEQPEARALLIADQRVHDQWMMGTPYVKGAETIDRFALAYKRNARCAIAEDLDELLYLPDEWGYPAEASRDALAAFNRQCLEGSPRPPRARDAEPLVDPPYYVIEVIPAITFTFGGLRIDPEARVLDEQGRPIPGLLAAGADSGGVMVRAYVGGLVNALIFGLRAAETALTNSAVKA